MLIITKINSSHQVYETNFTEKKKEMFLFTPYK